jgi:hypothetical protein
VNAPLAALVIVAAPLLPFATMLKVNALPSGSLALNVPLAGVFSPVWSVLLLATGTWLPIVTVTVATFELASPSLALNVKVSLPLAAGMGV